MSNLRWTDLARIDVDNLYDFIARRDRRPATADLVVSELIEACQRYADLYGAGSEIGTAVPDLGEGYLVFTHKRWVIVFRSADSGIEVMRVLDGSRDYPRLF